jgi:cyclic beta-1,2-glucan synthetase
MNVVAADHAAPTGTAADLAAESPCGPGEAGPIRAEVFGLERLDALARSLAGSLVLAPAARASSPLLGRFEDNGRALVRAHRRIVADDAPREGRGLDAEWLADNFHIVEDVLREVRQDLPRGYDAELPKLAEGPSRGHPRVYALALALVAHADSELDEARLDHFLRSFQAAGAALTIGELWAWPTMLRLVLLENLRRLADQMLWVWDERRRAERWVAAGPGPAPAAHPAGRAEAGPAQPEPTAPWVVRVLQLLRDQGARSTSALSRLDAQLAARGEDANEVLRREHRRQAANQVSVGNCVTSLRLLSALDWNAFFERHSAVEAILRTDPSGTYSAQDFATRDRQRRAVERIARRSGADETRVARRAIERAQAGAAEGAARGHVGYYLIDRGQVGLKAELGYRPSGRERLYDAVVRHPRTVYFGSILALLALFVAVPVWLALGGAIGRHPLALLLIVLAAALPASELAVGLVNHLLTLLLPPRSLSKLDFRKGIAADCPTFVVMPSMLVRPESAAMLLERLEIHYLANPDPQLRFALLTDFADAPQQHMPEDDGYVRDALERVAALNARHAAGGPDKFFLFHRRRTWNPVQGCWMGWERKRGKLSEFNHLLRGDRGTSYAATSADPGTLPHTRFVITLDADTQMPRDTAQRLVGTLAHPLNQPRFDQTRRRVVEGYGVLQPRVSFHLTAATRSRFAGLLAASGGIDPYSTAVSDVYMDLFGIGSFTGKGIYDVDAFEAATGRTFPENRILSHDLIEGNYARCGLATDIELFDDFPARYHAYARRDHRWVRGDWQLLPWLGRTVPKGGEARKFSQDRPEGSSPVEAAPTPPTAANPLPLVERWKLFDNLRRSLVPPALVALLALGWTVLPGSPWLWTAAALAVPMLPLFQVVLGTMLGVARSRSLAGVRQWRDSIPATAGQGLFSVAFLADQALTRVDAIGRTLARLFVSRRDLLEWETAAATERRLGTALRDFWVTMWPSSALAATLAIVVGLANPAALGAAGPVLIAWALSPAVACWISRPRRAVESPLSDEDRRALRTIARRTWHFFETFVGVADHWLPPDNFQEEPDGRVAHRTSPTNQGLLLLSTLTAHDLGYIGLRSLVERLEKTFDTLGRLERDRGHFYNWYDTRTLRPLPPRYISTVDSGNLLGCLLTLKQGLAEKMREPGPWSSPLPGALDTLGLVAEEARALPPPTEAEGPATYRALESDLVALERVLRERPDDPAEVEPWLGKVEWGAVGILGRVKALAGALGKPPEALERWARALVRQVQDWRADVSAIAPWLAAWPASAEIPPEIRGELGLPAGIGRFTSKLEDILSELAAVEEGLAGEARDAIHRLSEAVRRSAAPDLLARLRRLIERAEAMAAAMDFRFLYKPDRHLFTIGYNAALDRLDGACYDLLASESCLTSLLAVARGDAPRRHWFQLGRPFIRAAGRVGLLSWGGTMFEYLMPRLLLRGLPGTLLAEAHGTAVARQVEYGRQAGVPWGISESAFSAQYVDGDYQYQSFGVPGLGLKRGLDQDLVIAPYATALATMVNPREALENLRRIEAEGGCGAYGFYEAIDYTRDRLPKGARRLVVRSYMAHHQGMSLVALANALLDEPMPRRFQAEPMVRAVELLLQERVPRDAPIVEPSEAAAGPSRSAREGAPLLSRRLTTPDTPTPRVQVLSNSQYHVMLTNAGSGSSTCRGLDVTRWREDATAEGCGTFLYVRDPARGLVWSAGHQPIGRPADEYEVVFSADKAAFRRVDDGIETLLEVTVSPERLAEVRRVTLTNRGDRPRELELTSYAEIVLGPHGGDLAHPAFGKLFLETEWAPGPGALLCRRRPRSREQAPLWAAHVSAADAAAVGEVGYETDRARFLGRGRTPADPSALDPGADLSGTTGPVLDPIVSLRRRVRVEPGGSAVVVFTTAMAETREEAMAVADHFARPGAAARAFELAWAHSLVEHRHQGWSPDNIHLFQRLAAHLVYAGSALRASPSTVAANCLGQSGLWRFGISGDRPILLARVAEEGDLPLVRQLLDAHAYLRLKGLEFDLVVLDEQPEGSSAPLHPLLREAVQTSDRNDLVDKPGGIFLRAAASLSEAERVLLQAVTRVVLIGDRGPLASQLDRIERLPAPPEPLAVTRARGDWRDADVEAPAGLEFANGLGGFAEGGREYRLVVRNQSAPDVRRNGKPRVEPRPRPVLPPAPWINVVANPACGFLVSEAGSGYTWGGNSQGDRLTPWNNDPVADPAGEALYLRDEESGEVWTPTPLPIPSESATLVRHGQGYTTFERHSHGLAHELTLFVPPDDPVKLVRLVVRNTGDRARRLSATYYAEWVLGTVRDATAAHVVTEVDPESGALLARNAFRADFASRVAFADVDRRPRTLTADRAEFLGRHGSPASPAGLALVELSGRVGAALDPCSAIQAKLDVAPGEEAEVVFLLGEAEDLDAARALLHRYREPGRARAALDEVKGLWDGILSAVQVRTPDPGMDLLLNRWLLYQVLSCRVWARSAFYQSGGAFGFRDQLQDVMALVLASPGEARAHLLRAAARQFVEGDVQHWWHPPAGRGVRTRFSDDLLWLPLVACHYVAVTGDATVLDERVPFVTGPVLGPGQEEDFGLPETTEELATLYDHCVRALERGLTLGEHGLPLMGTGDWNDGMNRVGSGGRGESVWDAWFLIAILRRFAEVADARGDRSQSAWCRDAAEALRAAVEEHAWDGSWYRRAYFDDGTPLGSAQNDECQIDAIAQTWAVISGAADPERARLALAAVEERLVRRDDSLILLFTPPFDRGSLEPGYIKGYVPGIRENGGQYTHAATWVVLAEALLGHGRRAVELFDLLNPIRHADSAEAVARYKVEPYVVAADVYGRPPHTGRGGWTWYTGSAAWLYRVALESILGVQVRGDRLVVDPCIPGDWPGFEVRYRRGSAEYRIVVENPAGVERGVRGVTLDGRECPPGDVPLTDDGQRHEIRVVLGGGGPAG